MKRLFAILIILAAILFSLSSCIKSQTKQKFTAYYFDWFDTATSIVGYENTKEDFEALQSVIKSVPDTTVLIFTYPTFDTSSKTGEAGKKSKFKPFCDVVAKQGGEVYELNQRDAVALEHQLAAWADKRGKKLSLPTASKIIYYCGTNLQTLRNELDKLIAFTGEREEITVDDAEKVVVKKLEARIFDLMDFVMLGNLDSYMSNNDIRILTPYSKINSNDLKALM